MTDQEPDRTPETTQEGTHAYFYRAGNLRADSPQGIRDAAIDWAVNDMPDPGATYKVTPGYTVEIVDAATVLPEGVRGDGRFLIRDVMVRITVPAGQARWQAPDSSGPDTDVTAEFREFLSQIARGERRRRLN